ncbi:hypothetical protein ACHAXA_008165 [Cyclostephanos tholiformis]|uniref:EXPERA domain-containing protein n=1 Tax=Cyclostephanos tholiformis TaxID=382380 RepID=A0ABD3RJG0_9STRA
MPTLQGHTRTAFLCFFISHIPITLLIDSQAVFPRDWYPNFLRSMVEWYSTTFKDELMMHPPTWFKSLVVIELLFQVPFFLVAVYYIIARGTRREDDDDDDDDDDVNVSIARYDGAFRSSCTMYGSSTVTTMIPILSSILFARDDATVVERGRLMCLYLPYIIFPSWLLVIAMREEGMVGTTDTRRKRR